MDPFTVVTIVNEQDHNLTLVLLGEGSQPLGGRVRFGNTVMGLISSFTLTENPGLVPTVGEWMDAALCPVDVAVVIGKISTYTGVSYSQFTPVFLGDVVLGFLFRGADSHDV